MKKKWRIPELLSVCMKNSNINYHQVLEETNKKRLD